MLIANFFVNAPVLLASLAVIAKSIVIFYIRDEIAFFEFFL
ncbi:hypothetical protein [Brachyspira hyodysenteriae]|nr:hypothetical protein [Brachyspira hyodysenteriae]MDA0081943.1 hypothetical protein [Brachyspira hyodysenteriae]